MKRLSFLLVAPLVALSAFGFWEDKSGEVALRDNAAITENDKPSSAVTKINVWANKTLWITNLTTKYEMTTPIVGYGYIKVQNCASNLIINADNSGYTGNVNCYFGVLDANTTVIVSNRYGLGSSAYQNTARAASSNSFKFGGDGLTNDVSLSYGTNGGILQPMWEDEKGVFVQNGSLSVYQIRFFNDAEVLGGTFGNGNLTNIRVPDGHTLTIGTNVYMKAGTGTSSGAIILGTDATDVTIRWGTSATNAFRYISLTGTRTKVICMRKDAFMCQEAVLAKDMGTLQVHNLADTCTLDLNGFDQSFPWIYARNTPAAKTRLLVTSETPATLTFFCRKANNSSSGDFLFEGQTSFTYAGVDSSTFTLRNEGQDATTSGKLAVTSGKLVLGEGADWGWGGEQIAASGTGTLVVSKKVFFHYPDAGIPANTAAALAAYKPKSVLTIADSAIVELGADAAIKVGTLMLGDEPVRKGVYGSQAAFEAGKVDADHVLPQLAGTGTLQAMTSGPRGMLILFR